MATDAPKKSLHPFYFLATLVLIFGILIWAQRVLVPLVLAILFAFLLTPVVRLLQRRGLYRVPAVVLVVAAFSALFITIAFAITVQTTQLIKRLPHYEKNIHQKITSMKAGGEESSVGKVMKTIDRVTKDLTGVDKDKQAAPLETRETTFWQFMGLSKNKKNTTPIAVTADPHAVLVAAISMVWETVRVAATIGLIVILVIVMLLFREDLRDRLIRVSGYGRMTITTRAFDDAGTRISDYMLRKSLVNGGFALFVGLGLSYVEWQFGLVHFAVLWGFLLAVLRFIPSLGVWLALIPPLILTFAGVESWWPVILVISLYAIGELICLNVIEPWLIGRHIGVSPLGGLVSLTIWTWVWGPVGLLLAIPLTVCLVVLGKYVPQLSFLSVLLSNEPAMETNVRYYQRLLAKDVDEATLIVEKYVETNTPETVYDEILLPALSYVKRDYLRGELTETDKKKIISSTEDILVNLWTEETDGVTSTNDTLDRPEILGYAVSDITDEIALVSLQHLLAGRGCQMWAARSATLTSEMLQMIDDKCPALVVLVSQGPGDWTRCRFLCKRVKSNHPKLKIIVARLGDVKEDEEVHETLAAAGAYTVCTTLLDTRNQVLQTLHWVQPSAPDENPASVVQN